MTSVVSQVWERFGLFACSGLAALLLTGLISCNPKSLDKVEPLILKVEEEDSVRQLYGDLSREFEKLRPQVIMPASGYLEYPYMIPAGFYKQMWDWDGFFIGNHLASLDPENGKYLQFWALNFLKAVDADGYVAGCITTEGPRPIFGRFAIKPFLAQGVYFASEYLGDFSWIRPHYEVLKSVISNREKYQKDKPTGLFFWEIAMQSGADNNPALNYYQDDKRQFLACDMNTWQYREYKAMAVIATELGFSEDVTMYKARANTLKNQIETHLWFDQDKSFFNIQRGSLNPEKRVSFSNFIPLLEGFLSQEDGAEMISRYLLNEEHMLAPYGIRSLSKQDPEYNNKNVIVPFSNWQGPVWPIANYLYSVGLVNYGFEKEAGQLATHLGSLVLKDIYAYGSMHENYHADTGEPLAPTAEQSDNGVFTGFVGWNLLVQNMLKGASGEGWMLLNIKTDREVQH
jgi:alpha,alpha-trehalase